LLMPRADQKYAVLVDTKRSRLYVYETGEGNPKLVADYYMTQGKNGSLKQKEGDQKTPLGVYQVISYLPKSKLADLYGAGAFPIDYPNEWDRRLGRTGHGIWLHGTPSDTFARPPLASDGCVVLTNEDLAHISRFIQPGVTPMVIAENVVWVSPDALAKEREGLRAAFEAWRGDWESLNMDRYLGHYHANFSGEGMGIAEWSSRKRAVNAGKAWIKVGVSNLSMFRYPGKDDLAVVTFDQDYKSSNLNSVAKKRQYWFHDGRKWHILDESTL
jgi:murein L,D-transpeptidase YafK